MLDKKQQHRLNILPSQEIGTADAAYVFLLLLARVLGQGGLTISHMKKLVLYNSTKCFWLRNTVLQSVVHKSRLKHLLGLATPIGALQKHGQRLPAYCYRERANGSIHLTTEESKNNRCWFQVPLECGKCLVCEKTSVCIYKSTSHMHTHLHIPQLLLFFVCFFFPVLKNYLHR